MIGYVDGVQLGILGTVILDTLRETTYTGVGWDGTDSGGARMFWAADWLD